MKSEGEASLEKPPGRHVCAVLAANSFLASFGHICFDPKLIFWSLRSVGVQHDSLWLWIGCGGSKSVFIRELRAKIFWLEG